ncbi:hypothetical protein BZG00_06915 [Salinivibrio kushneri]|uniref:Very short patch repair endonuclease n=1 Tax=Salinivibrio kushneri TaxID=1908198 RepID=A0AB36JZW9_9GAMM|nr:hypothetical protein BZG00_06915 [Salinivibrio kushneri]
MPKTRMEYWRQKLERTVQRDKEKNRELAVDGWHVFTAWECESKEAPGKIVEQIHKFLRE